MVAAGFRKQTPQRPRLRAGGLSRPRRAISAWRPLRSFSMSKGMVRIQVLFRNEVAPPSATAGGRSAGMGWMSGGGIRRRLHKSLAGPPRYSGPRSFGRHRARQHPRPRNSCPTEGGAGSCLRSGLPKGGGPSWAIPDNSGGDANADPAHAWLPRAGGSHKSHRHQNRQSVAFSRF